jgi:hypothetical protein
LQILGAEFSLDPVYAQFYDLRLFVIAVNVLLDVYSLGLWSFAFVRTRRQFFVLLAVCSIGALLLALVGGAFAYDFAGMKRFDPANRLYGVTYFVVQPLVALGTVVGQTLLVACLLRARAHDSRGV